MFSFSLFRDKLFFRIGYDYLYTGDFLLGLFFSVDNYTYIHHNDDPKNEPVEEELSQYALSLGLGLISFHIDLSL